MKPANSYKAWKSKDLKVILERTKSLSKYCKDGRGKKNTKWVLSAKEAAELLGRSVDSIKGMRRIYRGE